MALPLPEPGLVISYAYLWHHEHNKGQEEGLKDRPCIIVLSVTRSDEETQVIVAPVTHSKPINPDTTMELPLRVKQHLKLDSAKSWVVLDEINQFTWPGFDVRPVPGMPDIYAYGFIPPRLFNRIKTGIVSLAHQRRTKTVPRDTP